MANASVQQSGSAAAARAAAAGAFADTVRSSPEGVTAPTNTAKKQLLGQ